MNKIFIIALILAALLSGCNLHEEDPLKDSDADGVPDIAGAYTIRKGPWIAWDGVHAPEYSWSNPAGNGIQYATILRPFYLEDGDSLAFMVNGQAMQGLGQEPGPLAAGFYNLGLCTTPEFCGTYQITTVQVASSRYTLGIKWTGVKWIIRYTHDGIYPIFKICDVF